MNNKLLLFWVVKKKQIINKVRRFNAKNPQYDFFASSDCMIKHMCKNIKNPQTLLFCDISMCEDMFTRLDLTLERQKEN